MDPVPDPLLLRKSGSAGDRTRDLCICSQRLTTRPQRRSIIGLHRTEFNRHSDVVPELCALLCVCACITYITRNHQPACKVPELWSFHGWYSSSAWGQLPVATFLSDPPSPPSPRSNPTDRPTNMWLRPLLGRRPTRSTWRTSKSERPSSCKKPSIVRRKMLLCLNRNP